MSDCIEWEGNRNKAGYGIVKVRRFGSVVQLAHRLVWIDTHGRLPGYRLCIMHTCDNPPCVNPEHLVEGTVGDNNRDRDMKGRNGFANKTHCPRGHEYTEENTRVYRGKRTCRACTTYASRKARRGCPEQF